MSAEEQMMRLLQALMSTHNQARSEAERFYTGELENNTIATMQTLVGIFGEASTDMVLKSFAGILIRRALEKYSTKLDAPTMISIRAKLQALWSAELNGVVLRRLAHILAQSAATQPWPDLLPSLISDCQNKQGANTIALMNFIEILSEYSPDDVQTHFNQLGSFLGSFIVNPSPDVQVACAKATAACIASLADETSRNAFRPALHPIVNIIGDCLNRGDELDATGIIEHLASIAQAQPIFFKADIDHVVGAMLTVAGSDGLEFPTRSIALELIVTFAETAPALARRCTALTQGLPPLAMQMATLVDESEAEWMACVYTEESTDGDFTLGEEALERASSGMGGRVIFPPVLALVEQYSGSAEWKQRRAAVAALARLAEGCTSMFLKQHIEHAKCFLSKHLGDASPVVQFEAIQLVGQLATLFTSQAEALVTQFLPILTAFLSNTAACERVRGHAAAALINIVNPEVCTAEMLAPHQDNLLRSLSLTLQTAPASVQSPCLTLLGCVAQVCEDAFSPYYSAFMPGVKTILATATGKEHAALRGKAMECVGLLGEAVSVSVFEADATEIMNMLLGALELDRESDITFEYVLPACARIAKALGARFEPVLPLIMGSLLAGATQKIDFCMEDADDDEQVDESTFDEETRTESAIITVAGGGKKRVTMNTHAVQQKQQAARLLYEFAEAMRGNLKAYLQPSMQALLDMVTDKHSSEIRSSASLAVAKMFEAFVHAAKLGYLGGEMLTAALSACLSKLLESLKGEVNITSRACASESMRDVLQGCYQSGTEGVDGSRSAPMCSPSLEISVGIAEELLACCADSISRRAKMEDAFNKNEGLEDEDREGFAEELEEEEELLTNLVDAIGQLVKLHGEAFMPAFDQFIVGAFAPYMAPNQPQALQVLAVCMVDDVIEFGGSAAHKYVPQALQVFLPNIRSDHAVLRQCSVYGIAQALRKAPQLCVEHLHSIVPALVQCVGSPAAKDEDNEGTTENAIFALGIIYNAPMFRPSGEAASGAAAAWGGVGTQQVAGIWLQGLPLRADEQEAKAAHSQLCDAVETGDAFILSHLSHLLRIFADILAEAGGSGGSSGGNEADLSLAHPQTVARVQAIARQMVQGGGSGVGECMSALTPSQRQALNAAM